MIHYPNDKKFGRTDYESRPDGRRIAFSPLMSYQRYLTVKEVLCKFSEQSPVSTVAEFGSNSFTFFRYYLLRCNFIDTVHQIDLDEDRIYSALDPISMEVERRHCEIKGTKPLTVNIFKGNVAEKDDRVMNSDVVIGIELIEHLTKTDFDQFPETIFNFIKPKLVILTTPNYDFNVLFENNGAFRDPDHRFEFTRQQFQNWAEDIVLKYPDYRVQIYGIGEPPEGCLLDVGFCSQMAVFQLFSPSAKCITSTQFPQAYTLVGSYKYFVFEERTSEEQVFDTVANMRARFKKGEGCNTVKFPSEYCDEHYKYAVSLDFVQQQCNSCLDMKTVESALDMYPLVYPIIHKDDVSYLELHDECNCYF